MASGLRKGGSAVVNDGLTGGRPSSSGWSKTSGWVMGGGSKRQSFHFRLDLEDGVEW